MAAMRDRCLCGCGYGERRGRRWVPAASSQQVLRMPLIAQLGKVEGTWGERFGGREEPPSASLKKNK